MVLISTGAPAAYQAAPSGSSMAGSSLSASPTATVTGWISSVPGTAKVTVAYFAPVTSLEPMTIAAFSFGSSTGSSSAGSTTAGTSMTSAATTAGASSEITVAGSIWKIIASAITHAIKRFLVMNLSSLVIWESNQI